VLKTCPPGRRRARLTLVRIDHDDPIVGPAKRRRASPKRVLTLRALDVLDDLPHRRLADVQVGVALEVMRLDLEGLVHGALPSLEFRAIAAKMSMTARLWFDAVGLDDREWVGG
jgi:hypothetical protein